MKYIDIEDGLKRVGGNKKLYLRMVGMFKSSVDFEKLSEQFAARDFEGAGESLHAIKGVAGNLSFTLLFEASVRLMEEIRDTSEVGEESSTEYMRILGETQVAVEELLASGLT